MRFVGPEDELQEEAFTWVTREDVWGGITDDTVRETLREHFVSEFEPTLAPHERGFDKVARILTEIANSMTNTSWSSSTEQLDEDDVSPFRLNALLAFHTQLQWMFQVFKDIPGASLSVR